MTQPAKTGSFGATAERVAAAVLGFLAVVAFISQASTFGKETTARETALFNSLQFTLTVGFTWFSTRAISRSEFEASLKRFAISAFRRIADIERMTLRLRAQVRENLATSPEGETGSLEVVDAIVGDTIEVIRSSISDWGDVIGDELLDLEKLRRLSREREEATARSESAVGDEKKVAEQAAEKIESLISNLRKKLPPALAIETAGAALSAQGEQHAAKWIASRHKEDGGLLLTIVSGDDYEHDRELNTLKAGDHLHTAKDEFGRLNAADSDGKVVGRIQNNSPLPYQGFVRAIEVGYGSDTISMECVEYDGEAVRNSRRFCWLKVRVVSEPNPPSRRAGHRRVAVQQGAAADRQGPRSDPPR